MPSHDWIRLQHGRKGVNDGQVRTRGTEPRVELAVRLRSLEEKWSVRP